MVNPLPDARTGVHNNLFDTRSGVLLFDSQSRLQVAQKHCWPQCSFIWALIGSNIRRFACSAFKISAKPLELPLLVAWLPSLGARVVLRKQAEPVSTTQLLGHDMLRDLATARARTPIVAFIVKNIAVILSKPCRLAVNALTTGVVARSSVPW